MIKQPCRTAGILRFLCMMIYLALTAACGSKEPLQNRPGCISNGTPMSSTLLTGENLPNGSFVMTFDGGPSDFTPDIGEFLWQNEIAATFFVAGRHVTNHNHTLERLKGIGHLVGNLSYNDSSLLSSPDPVQAIRRTDELITPYVTGDIFLLRPPQGEFSDDLATKIEHAGMRKYVGPIGWDVGTTHDLAPAQAIDLDCWQTGQDPDACATRYMTDIRSSNKGIIVFHDTDENSLPLVKKVVALARNESFGFIRLDAIPTIKRMIDSNGGTFNRAAGATACNDYN